MEFQCTRNGPQNSPFCSGSLQDTFIIYSSISHQHIPRNLKIQKPRFTNRSPEKHKSEHLLMNLQNRVFHKNCFFGNSGGNWGGLGVSGRSARSIRNFSLELWQDLVLHGIRKSTFQHLTVNWNFNVLEMALKTLHFVQGLSRTPLLFIPRYLTNIFFENNLRK